MIQNAEIISKIIPVINFTRNHVWNWNEIISAAGGVLKLFQNYFSDIEHVGKHSWAATIPWNNYFEIMWGKFLRVEINSAGLIIKTLICVFVSEYSTKDLDGRSSNGTKGCSPKPPCLPLELALNWEKMYYIMIDEYTYRACFNS